MTDVNPSFSGLKITNYYKYILYLSGVILVLTLFLEPKGVNAAWLRHISFWVIIAGLIIWFFKSILDRIYTYSDNAEDYILHISIVDYAFQIVVWFLVWTNLF